MTLMRMSTAVVLRNTRIGSVSMRVPYPEELDVRQCSSLSHTSA